MTRFFNNNDPSFKGVEYDVILFISLRYSNAKRVYIPLAAHIIFCFVTISLHSSIIRRHAVWAFYLCVCGKHRNNRRVCYFRSIFNGV